MDLDYLEADLDDIGVVLATKMIELRIYTDICYTEEEIKNIEDDKDRNNKGKIFLNKIKWFKDWIDMKNLKLLNAGLTEIDEMEIDDILNTVIVTDSAGFKRRKVYDEACSTSIYVVDEEEICMEEEDAFDFSSKEIFNRLML